MFIGRFRLFIAKQIEPSKFISGMGNCCQDEKLAIIQAMADNALEKDLRLSAGKFEDLRNSDRSLIAIDDESIRSSSKSLNDNYYQKGSQKGTVYTNDQSAETHTGRESYKEHWSNDGDYFHKFSPLPTPKKSLEDGFTRRFSEEYKPHKFRDDEEMDLRGTLLNFSKGNLYEAGLSVITEVNPIWESSELTKTQLGLSSHHPLRGTDKISLASVILGSSNASNKNFRSQHVENIRATRK